MSVTIPHSSLFHTPQSLEELQEYCMQYSGAERQIAFVASMMALNLAHKMVTEAQQ